MTARRTRVIEERVLVLAPTGRDAKVTRDVLATEGIGAEVCAGMGELCAALEDGAGALLIAEEALSPDALATLTRALGAQPTWSDIPLVVTVLAGDGSASRERAIRALEPSGNVNVLERPVRVFTLVVAIQAALRARRRQYQMRDLLEQMQAQMERLHSERELRARFVSMLAHDLRGPVNAAMMAAEMIVRAPERLDQRQELGVRIQRNLKRVDRMMRDLLDASRIQAGMQLPLRLERSELCGIAREVVDEVNDVHGELVRLHCSGEILGVWSAEELRRAIWNLITNAVKYGAPGTPVTTTISAAGGWARIEVHNHGRPITPQDQRRIFEPFARAADAERGSQIGWGLGLTLVRGCAESHGGTLRVSSSADHGTTFTMELPRQATAVQSAGDALAREAAEH